MPFPICTYYSVYTISFAHLYVVLLSAFDGEPNQRPTTNNMIPPSPKDVGWWLAGGINSGVFSIMKGKKL